MQQLLLVIHVLLAVSIIALVLIQHGKGADIGAAFGSGASQTVFGSQGSGGFLMKITGLLAALFFATSLSLSYLATHEYKAQAKAQLPTTPTKTLPAQQQTQQKSLPVAPKNNR